MADQGMPTTYDTQQTTTTHTTAVGPQMDYVRTIPGILKILEMVLSFITFICAIVWPWGAHGGSWVQFVSMFAFLSTLILFLLYFMGLYSRIPGPRLLVEFIYYCVFTAFFLIAAIVAAARGNWHSSIGAAAFFAFGATAVYAVDTFFQYRAWRTGNTETTMTTTTTTTHQAQNMDAEKAVY